MVPDRMPCHRTCKQSNSRELFPCGRAWIDRLKSVTIRSTVWAHYHVRMCRAHRLVETLLRAWASRPYKFISCTVRRALVRVVSGVPPDSTYTRSSYTPLCRSNLHEIFCFSLLNDFVHIPYCRLAGRSPFCNFPPSWVSSAASAERGQISPSAHEGKHLLPNFCTDSLAFHNLP